MFHDDVALTARIAQRNASTQIPSKDRRYQGAVRIYLTSLQESKIGVDFKKMSLVPLGFAPPHFQVTTSKLNYFNLLQYSVYLQSITHLNLTTCNLNKNKNSE